MAKISRHGGPSNHEPVAPIQHALSRRPQLGVMKSVQGRGGSSTPSTESELKKDNSESQSPQQPAQTTENPSNPEETESFIADSTDGSTQETPKPRSVRKAAKKAMPRSRVVGDEFDEPVDLSGHDDFK